MSRKPRTCNACGAVLAPRVRCQSEQCFRLDWRSPWRNAAQATASNAARIGNGYVPREAARNADERLRVQRGY